MALFTSRFKNFAPSVTLCFFLLFHGLNTHASETTTSTEKLYQLIFEKLEFYNQTFPEIQFAHLRNGEWEKSLQALELFIGYQAANLDYEHPEDVREELLFVTVEKIRLMLINKITSSYLFKAGEQPAAKRKHICIITLDPATTVLDNRVATSYLVDLPDEILDSLPENKYLDNKRHLDFILDHEVFHCLDTYYHGGIPMSDKEYSTYYDIYKRESQADMFAIAMNIFRNKTLTPCAKNMINMRGMTLLNGEPQHYSVDAMQLILGYDQTKLRNMKPTEIFRLIKERYKTMAPNYDDYMSYRVAAVEAIKKLGKELNEIEKPPYPAELKPDLKLTDHLVTQTRSFYKSFTGEDYQLPR